MALIECLTAKIEPIERYSQKKSINLLIWFILFGEFFYLVFYFPSIVCLCGKWLRLNCEAHLNIVLYILSWYVSIRWCYCLQSLCYQWHGLISGRNTKSPTNQIINRIILLHNWSKLLESTMLLQWHRLNHCKIAIHTADYIDTGKCSNNANFA